MLHYTCAAQSNLANTDARADKLLCNLCSAARLSCWSPYKLHYLLCILIFPLTKPLLELKAVGSYSVQYRTSALHTISFPSSCLLRIHLPRCFCILLKPSLAVSQRSAKPERMLNEAEDCVFKCLCTDLVSLIDLFLWVVSAYQICSRVHLQRM